MSLNFQEVVREFSDKKLCLNTKRIKFYGLNQKQCKILYKTITEEVFEILDTNDDKVFGNCNVVEQIDVFIDLIYYILDFCNSHGINLEDYFMIVHNANMSKMKDEVITDKDGIVKKPANFISPELEMIKKYNEIMKSKNS